MAAGTKVGEAYVELQARMAKFESQLKSAEVMTGKSVSKMQAKFQALAPTFRKVGIGMAVAGGAITAALGLTIKSSMSFNKEMANIATLIPGATDRVIELKGAIQEMAVDVGKATGDLAAGGYQVISAFGDTADTVAILEISAKAATAGVATTTSAINLLSAVTKGYGDTSKEAIQKASDLAFMTVKLGQTDFPQLEASIGRVIPLTAEMGVSQEELFAVMATGTGVTGKAAEVATQFRGVMQSLMAPTADMIKLLEEKGYASGKAMLADLGLAGALELIKTKADESNTPLQKYISSIEGQTIALALTGTQADTYKEKLLAMMDVTGQTDIAFKEQTEGINAAGFAFEQAKIRIGVLGQEIGDRLLPMITPLIEKITDIVKKMSDWAKEHPKLSSGIIKFAAVLGPLLIGLGGFLIILPKLIALIPLLKIGMIKLGGAFHFMLGPIGLIIIAITAAVAAFIYFYKTSEKFRDFINKIGAYMKALAQNIWNHLVWLKDNWGKIWKTIFEGLPKIAKNAFDNLITIFKWVWEFIKGWGSWLGKNFINVWKNMFSAVSTGLKNFGTNIVAQLGWLGQKMNPKNWFKKIERPDWTPLFDGLEAKWEEMPKIAELNLKKMTEGVKVYFEPLPELVEPVFKAIEEGAEGAGKAIDGMTTATEKYITTFDALQKGIGKVNDALDLVIVKLKEIGKVIMLPVYVFWGQFEKGALAVKEAWDDTSRGVNKATGEMVSTMYLAESKLAPIYDKFVDGIVGVGKAYKVVGKGIKKETKDMSKDVKQGLLAMKESWAETATSIEDSADDIVEAIVGMVDAVTLFWGKFKKGALAVKESWKDTRKGIDTESGKIVSTAYLAESKLTPIYDKFVDGVLGFGNAYKITRKVVEKEVPGIVGITTDGLLAMKEGWDDTARGIEDSTEDIIDSQIEMVDAVTLFWGKQKKGLLAIKEGWKEVADAAKDATDKAKKAVKTFAEIAAEEWAGAFESIARTAFSSFVDIIRGVKTMEEAFLDFAKKLQTVVADALLNLAIQAAAMGDAVGAVLLGLAALVVSLWDKMVAWLDGSAERARELEAALGDISHTTEILGEAFKDVGASLTGSINDAERAIRNLQQSQEDLALNTRDKLIKELDNYYDYRVLREMSLDELLALSAETRLKLEQGTLEEIAETAEETAEREKDAKISTLEAIEEAYKKEAEMIDKKIKLIEIEIKLMMAAALAEQGKFKEAEKLRKEAMHDLGKLLYTEEEMIERIEEAKDALRDSIPWWKKYGKEGEKSADIIRDALKRTGREMKLMEDSTDDARYGIEDWGDAGRRNAQKLVEGFEEARDAIEDWGEAGRRNAQKLVEEFEEVRIGIEEWGKEINKLPEKIEIGWDIPPFPEITIPKINIPVGWNIADFPKITIPKLPTAQIGIPNIPRTMPVLVHRKEAILTAPQAEEWRAGRGGLGGNVTFQRGAVIMRVQNLNTKADVEELVDLVETTMVKTIEKKSRGF